MTPDSWRYSHAEWATRLRSLAAIALLLVLSSPARAEVRRAKTVTLIISSSPPEATLLLDGKPSSGRDRSGEHTLHVTTGEHRLRLELDGYRPIETTISAQHNHRFPVFKLERVHTYIAVSGTGDAVRGATVVIDGKEAGTAPGQFEVRPGAHVVELRKPGFVALREEVVVEAGSTREVRAMLQMEKERGNLIIQAPAGQIFVDGVERGPSPQLVEGLEEKVHVIEVRDPLRDSAVVWRREVRVVAGQVTRVLADAGARDGEALQMEVTELRKAYHDLKRTIDSVQAERRVQLGRRTEHPVNPSVLKGEGVPFTPPSAMKSGSVLTKFMEDVHLHAYTALRYDWTEAEDQTDQLYDPDRLWNRFATKVRFGVTYDGGGLVTGGFRFAVGQNPNPASAFISLGEGTVPKLVGLDMFYAHIRPLRDRDRIYLTIGKMPNPAFRGDKGTVRDELIWDDDINPEGVNLHVTFYRSPSASRVKLDNELGFFVADYIQPFRFRGVTGGIYQVVEQLRLRAPYLNLALNYIATTNLNAGLLSPQSNLAEGSAFPMTGQSAFLLRGGRQATNNRCNAGPGADRFCVDTFHVGAVQVQAYAPWKGLKYVDKLELFFLGNYTRNFAAAQGQNGYGLTVGLSLGDLDAKVHPFNIWATWRDVDADATLSLYADSDLGAGTQYRGVELGANYRISRHFTGQLSFFDYQAFPLKDFHIRRIFIDLVADF